MHITRIRAGREKGGLRPQHLSGIELVADMVAARLKNAFVNSTDITFWPMKPKRPAGAGADAVLRFEADTRTAGSTGLLIQVSLPVMLFLPFPSVVTYKGGTNAIKVRPCGRGRRELTSCRRTLHSVYALAVGDAESGAFGC